MSEAAAARSTSSLRMEHDHGWFFTGCSSEKDLLSTGARTLMSGRAWRRDSAGNSWCWTILFVVLAGTVGDEAVQRSGRQVSGDP
ncbi:MAG: hypothetical protein M3492_00585 [Actinomycetota bacterium]|nr:hypothetical protein [Actinomycetota bacterium]